MSENKRPELKHEESGKRNSRNRKHNVVNNFFDYQSYRDSPEYHQQHRKHVAGRTKRGSFDKKKKRLFLHGMRFINLNYKFIVDGRKQYAMQQLDPNVPVDTGDIIRILVPKGPSCPICLSDDLVAPRMITSCGHILCLTCLLSLLSSEVPTQMKRESKAVIEKYNDCPLCGSIIRKHDVKPVKMVEVDERFEIPKIGSDVILTLMARDRGGIVPAPRYAGPVCSFPWVEQSEYGEYSRFFKADLAYILAMYEQEKADVQAAFDIDRELYSDDGKYATMAFQNIEADIQAWSESFSSPELAPESADPTPSGHAFYYYQTGFKASATYVLSPLDVKVLKSSYDDSYTQLPDTVVAKVENIRYEELDTDLATAKYKYLSHLPLGTLLGFLECTWKHNQFVSQDAWKQHEPELTKRSKNTAKKLRKEEMDRLRAINDTERRAREYIERENNGPPPEDSHDWHGMMGSLSITDHRELPALSESATESSDAQTKKSIWGTQIPTDEDDKESLEMIRKAREEIERQQAQGSGKRKRKQKYVLLSS